MQTTRLAAVLSLTMVLSSCGGTTPPAAAPEPAAPEPAAPEPAAQKPDAPAAPEAAPVGQQAGGATKPDVPPPGASPGRLMRAHFTDALLIRKAVIAGTPEQAASAAEALSKSESLEALPAGWRPFVERMQLTAGRINNSTSASQAAAATADLGVACGECHLQRGGPKASTEPAPAQGTALTDRMQRHVWATERLWEGLTVPSSEAWAAGAKALSASPFPAEILKQGGVHGRSAAGDFKKLVGQAPTKKKVEERAALYAELLVTCGGCHRAINEAGTK